MNPFLQLAQAAPPTNFWAEAPGTPALYVKLVLGFIAGFAVFVGLMQTPAQLRRHVVAFVTFIAGLYWVLLYVWPAPVDWSKGEGATGPVDGFGIWLKEANGPIVSFSTTLTSFMVGLGIYSLLRVHFTKLFKRQKDWFFSLTLLVAMFLMVFFGYMDWFQRLNPVQGAKLDEPTNWTFIQFGRDFMFEGLLQQMDAVMFSLIAFYILSAAYRAFRVRSIEATILLMTALIVMVSLMGAVSFTVDQKLTDAFGADSFWLNFRLNVVAAWLRDTFQTASLRGIAFGVGIGALAMGLRLWLSLERTGGTA